MWFNALLRSSFDKTVDQVRNLVTRHWEIHKTTEITLRFGNNKVLLFDSPNPHILKLGYYQ